MILSKTFRLLSGRSVLTSGSRFIHQKNEVVTTDIPTSEGKNETCNFVDYQALGDAVASLSEERESILDPCNEDISYIATYLKPSFNFAAYVNKSETLKELLKLNVNLHKLEKKADVPEYILRLNFENDVKEHVIFLHDLGLQTNDIGEFISKNPYIFKEPLDHLRTRIRYLKFKKFNDEMILRIMHKNPFWLQFSTQQIDERLGFFQNRFSLTGNEVRKLAVKKPRIITYKIHHIKVNHFVVKEEMGFEPEEVKSILLDTPGVFMTHQEKLLKVFEFLHKTMQIPLETICKTSKALTFREHKWRERYLFLKKLNRIQFDPTKPNYISLLTLVSGSDSEFATDIAKSSIQAYNEFQKSL